jgi:long-chain acyl-CoA synthetase
VTLSSSADFLAHPGTVGRAVPGAIVRALDENGNDVPTGTPGELFMRIPYYPDFIYHNQPDKRREIDPTADQHRRRRLFRRRGVSLYLRPQARHCDFRRGQHLSRRDRSSDSRAYRRQGLRVFGIPDAEFGEALMAIVEPQDGSAITPDGVRAHLKGQLADYKVPRQIEIGKDLTREDSGKISKGRLREPYWREAGRAI